PSASSTPSSPASTTPAPESAAVELSPVPRDAGQAIEQFVSGGLDGELAARTLDQQLAARLSSPPALLEGAPGWSVSARRALVLAVLRAPAPLRDELRRLEEPLEAAEDAKATADLAAGKLARALAVADRYPCVPFAADVRARLDEARAEGPHEVLELGALPAPIAAGSLAFNGITVAADGQEGLVARDVDGNQVWDYRLPPCTDGDFRWLRVVGSVRERIVAVAIAHANEPAVCLALDATTGNELFRVPVFALARDGAGRLETVDTALGGVELVISTAGKVAVVDVRRGELAWRRTGLAAGRLSSVGAERVVLAPASGDGPGIELELATGRRAGGTTPARPKSGSIEIK